MLRIVPIRRIPGEQPEIPEDLLMATGIGLILDRPLQGQGEATIVYLPMDDARDVVDQMASILDLIDLFSEVNPALETTTLTIPEGGYLPSSKDLPVN